MQIAMMLIGFGLILLALAGAAFWAVFVLGRMGFALIDGQQAAKGAQSAEPAADEREAKMRRYSMTDLRPVKSNAREYF